MIRGKDVYFIEKAGARACIEAAYGPVQAWVQCEEEEEEEEPAAGEIGRKARTG